MRIDLFPRDAWMHAAARYRQALPFQDLSVQVQPYLGYRHALWESSQAFAQLFSTKKTVGIAVYQEPAFEAIANGLSAEGFKVISLSAADLADPSTWLPAALDDLLFVMTSEEDPVTGALETHPAVDLALKEKRVFRIKLTHGSHHLNGVDKPDLFEAKVLSLAFDRALIVAGARARLKSVVASQLPWPNDSHERALEELEVLAPHQVNEWRTRVLAFESSLPSGFQPLFKKGVARSFDRAVIYHAGLDGSAVIDELAKTTGGTIATAGLEGSFEATSLCRWQSPRQAEWLKARGWKDEEIRGTILIAAPLIENDLAERIKTAGESLLKLQRTLAE